MPYLAACVNEALRMHSAAATLPRIAAEVRRAAAPRAGRALTIVRRGAFAESCAAAAAPLAPETHTSDSHSPLLTARLILITNLTQDVEVGGYHIPKGTHVTADVWSMHRCTSANAHAGARTHDGRAPLGRGLEAAQRRQRAAWRAAVPTAGRGPC